MELHELGEVELGLLEDLDLSDEDILQRVDASGLLLDLGRDGLGVSNPVMIEQRQTELTMEMRWNQDTCKHDTEQTPKHTTTNR